MRTFKAREYRKSVNILVRIKSNGIWIDGRVHSHAGFRFKAPIDIKPCSATAEVSQAPDTPFHASTGADIRIHANRSRNDL